MSDTENKTVDASTSSTKPARKSAAEQVAADAKPADTSREVQQTIVTTISIPVKEGQSVSDAVKEYMVQQGGFEGSPVLPGPTGAIMEREIREGQSDHMNHPAIDSNPRRGLPPVAMQRDMNDPRFDRQDASQGQAAPVANP